MTAINAVTDLSYDGEVALVTLNSPPVNALSAAVREGMYDGIKAALESDAKAIILICEGRTFIAGADITELGGAPKGPSLIDVQHWMEDSTKPVIAAIHGTALGGGLEMALCAHYRVAVPSAKLGLPEVNLGLLPGAGGTQRLPRVAGPEKAVQMVAFGIPVSAKEALAMGLVDELVEEGKLREGAIAFARKVVAEGRPLTRIRDKEDKIAPFRGKPEIFQEFRKANARAFRGFKAPENNIKTIEAAVNLPFDEGIAEERRLFGELISGSQSAAQRYYFFAERAAQKVPDVPADTPVREIKKVGVLGAGTMGGGIAMNFLNIGVPVTIVEMQQEALDRGLSVIRANYERSRGVKPEQVEQRMGLLKGSIDMADLKDCDLIVEAVYENMDVKKDVFAKLDAVAKPGAILASNTSFLDLNEIASATKRPQDVIGMHFFSPANVMKLLEIVRGKATAKDVLATILKVGKQIGKNVVVSGVGNGFIANRVAGPRSREAQTLLLAGAEPTDIDRVIYDFGFPMGPFAMIDVVGLDVIKPPPGTKTINSTLVEMGRRGQKSGGGFYDYDEKRNARPSPEAGKVIEQFRKDAGVTSRKIGDDEILERSIYSVINEGAKVLEEGIAMRASDIDVALVNGYGWPVYTGGPMFYADLVGVDKVVAKLKEFESKYGEQYKPAALLERVAAEGKKLSQV
ncbi:MAG: fatty oxidation complex, alpha subunit [Phenylobacterium sp.]|nr:fatty oxidation complex, alpha subunit [Phenylobacterium sp.]